MPFVTFADLMVKKPESPQNGPDAGKKEKAPQA